MTLWKINVSFTTAVFAGIVNACSMSISPNIKHDLCEALRNNVSSNLGISEDQQPQGMQARVNFGICKFKRK